MKEQLFYIPLDGIPKGTYEVYELPDGTDNGANVKLKQEDVIFVDNGSLAEDWLGFGVIATMMKQDKVPGIVCNPDDYTEMNEDC